MTLAGLTLATSSNRHLKLFKHIVIISKVNYSLKKHSDKSWFCERREGKTEPNLHHPDKACAYDAILTPAKYH